MRQRMELLRFPNGDCSYKVDLNQEFDLLESCMKSVEISRADAGMYGRGKNGV